MSKELSYKVTQVDYHGCIQIPVVNGKLNNIPQRFGYGETLNN